MDWLQYCVVVWMQFAIGATIMLGLTWLSLHWIAQPVERLRLILVVLIAVVALPWIIAFASVPSWRLGWIAAESSQPDEAVAFNIGNEFRTPRIPKEFYGVAEVPHTSISADAKETTIGSFSTVVESTPTLHLPLHATQSTPWFASLDAWTTLGLCIASLHVLAGALFAVEFIIGRRRLYGLYGNSTQATESVFDAWRRIAGTRGAKVQLRISSELTSPLLFGWRRSVVIVPRSIANRGSSVLDACLAHEWSHLDRRDLLAWRLTTYCQFLLWYQPAFWVLRRELRLCQEFLADHHSTQQVIAPVEYSELLMAMAKGKLKWNVAESLSMFERSGQLTRRINMLLFHQGTLKDRCRKRFTIGALALVAMTTIAISSLRIEAEANATEQIDLPESIDPPEPESHPQVGEPTKKPKKPKTPQATVEPKVAILRFPGAFGRPEIVGRSVSYRCVRTVGGKVTEEQRYFIAPDGRERLEWKQPNFEFVLVKNKDRSKSLSLTENPKRAHTRESPFWFGILGRPQSNAHLRILQIYIDLVLQDRKAKDLGIAIVDGKQAQGYSSSANRLTVWIDNLTSDLVRVEEDRLFGLGRETYSDFLFDADVDESLFSLEVPKGYELFAPPIWAKTNMKVKSPTLEGLQKVWTRREFSSDLETAPAALISSLPGQLISRNEQGKTIARTTVRGWKPVISKSPRQICSSLADPTGKYQLFYLNAIQFLDGTVGVSVVATNAQGKPSWRFPEMGDMTNEVNDLCATDLYGDKKTNIVVGLMKDGLQVLDEQGHLVWKNSDVSIVGNIETANLDSDTSMELLCSSLQGDVLVIDSDGTFLRKIDPGFSSHMVRVCTPIGSIVGQPWILSAGSSHGSEKEGKGEQTKLAAMDIAGNQKWSVDLSGRVVDSAISTSRPWLSVALADGSVRVIDVSSGKEVSRLESHTVTNSTRVAWFPSKDADPLLVIGISGQTTAFRIDH